MEPTYIAAIEIGSSHIRAAVGRVDETGTLSVLGVEEECAIDAVRYGAVQNVEEVSNRISKLKLKLENHQTIHPRKIKAVYVALGGRSTMGASATVERAYNEETEITADVLRQLNDEARAQAFSDRTVVQVLPRQFVVDNMDIANPRGTFGRDIHAEFNLITCKPMVQKNLVRAISDRQQLAIKGILVRQTALAALVLSSDEKKLGCMLVDFGAETTTVSIYKNGFLTYFATLPIGSRCITRDIMTLGYTEEKAEEIKRNIGDAINAEPAIRKHDFDGDPAEVNNYVRARAGEIAANIIEQPKYAGLSLTNDLPAGIILVGGGSRLRGFPQLLQSQQSNVKVRLGSLPPEIRISDPRLQSIDTLDVISILNIAARVPQECTEMPEPTVAVDSAYDEEDGPGINPKKNREKKKEKNKGNGGSSIDRIMGRLSKWFQEPDDNDE